MPKVSVIMPAYNAARYIRESVDSALAQTYQDFELIVIDDGSTDETQQILSQYGDKIRYIYQENKGVSAARNRGIREAKGEYIAFLDSDDIWLEDKLKWQVQIADQNPEINLIFSDVESFNDKGVFKSSYKPSDGMKYEAESLRNKIAGSSFNDGSIFKGNFFKELLKGNMILTSTVFIRKQCLEKSSLFDEALSNAEDYDLYLSISRTNLLLYFNRVTTRYRLRDDSLSGSVNERLFTHNLSIAKVLERHLSHIPQSDKELIIKTMIVNSYNVAIWGYFNVMELKKARGLCLRSLQYDKFQIKIYLYLLATFFPAGFIKPRTRLES